MELYYKTAITSETGEKFAEIKNRCSSCDEQVKSFLAKYGFEEYRRAIGSLSGGISSCCNPNINLDTKLWKESGYGPDEYMPKLNSKKGMAIMHEINALPIVELSELNEIVGYKAAAFNTSNIGFHFDNNGYFGFILLDKWGVKPPVDCEEITASEYKELFM